MKQPKEKTNRQRRLHNKNLSDASMSRFLELLKYKCEWRGIPIRQIGRFEASTCVCSKCGHKMPSMPTAIRLWVCPECKTIHDRDINAAKVIDSIANCSLTNE